MVESSGGGGAVQERWMLVDDPSSAASLGAGRGPWTATLQDDLGQTWRSDSTTDPQALLWSMRLDVAPSDPRAMPYPEVTTASLQPLRIEVIDTGAAHPKPATYERRFLATGVTRRRLRGSDLVADLFLPAGPGPHPGVVVVGGSSGGLSWSAQVAALLAAHGHASLAVAYFDWAGEHGLPTSITEIPVETALHAIQTLSAQATIGGEGIAVIGASRGSELAVLTALAAPTHVRALALFSPSAYAWEAARTDPAAPPRSSWTLNGHPLPFLPLELDEDFYKTFDKTRLRRFHQDSIARHPDAAAAARLAVEHLAVRTLLLTGGQDGVWPSSEMASTISTVMSHSGSYEALGHLVTHLDYPAAGHFLGPPGLPCSPADGNRAATALANRCSWDALLTHFGTSTAQP